MFYQIVNGSVDFFLHVCYTTDARKEGHMIPILGITWGDFWASCIILFAIYSYAASMK